MALARWRPRPEADPGSAVDPIASQPFARITRRTAILAATGVVAYLAALVWNIPAAIALSRPAGVAVLGGTVWRGHAILADGEALEWRWAPLRSLVNFAFAVDWSVTGPGTELAGQALIGPHSTTIDDASGSATGALLAVAMPSLTFVCGMPLQIAIDRVRIGGDVPSLVGEIRSDPGLCAPKGGGAATSVPALSMVLRRLGNGSEMMLAPSAQRRRILAEATLDRASRLHLKVTPEGGRVLPFLSPPGGIAIDMTL